MARSTHLEDALEEPMGQLDGKVAIVTGCGRGIGREVALRLARDGAQIVVNDLDDEPARETIALVEKEGRRAVACVGNVTAPDFGDRIVETAVTQQPLVDIAYAVTF